jgi:glycosyltransferase involved in cell wall biosynthesis
MGIPLIESGKYKVHLIANRQASFSECYNTFGHWLEVGQLHNLIKLHAKDADVFHVHNEPSWFVTLIKETCDVPVVLDVHDSYLARTSPEEAERTLGSGDKPIRISVEERNNFQLADALVFPGESFKNLLCEEFNLKQPSIVLRSHVPRRMYRYNMQDWLGGLCYEGKTQVNTDSRVSHGFRYCDYKELARQCKEKGLPFHLYGARDDKEFMEAYKDTAIIHEPMVFDTLIKNIARHDWGLVGNITSMSEWDYAMPNKLFEYIAACVPIVALNAKECGEYITEHGIGISVKSLDELMKRWPEHREIRKTLIKKRVQFSMEKNIEVLETLYGDLCRN